MVRCGFGHLSVRCLYEAQDAGSCASVWSVKSEVLWIWV